MFPSGIVLKLAGASGMPVCFRFRPANSDLQPAFSGRTTSLATPADATQNAGPKTGSATTIQRYNLWNRLGWQGHPDGVQLNGGNFTGSIWSFNMFYLRPAEHDG
jgi:hypothetical protein